MVRIILTYKLFPKFSKLFILSICWLTLSVVYSLIWSKLCRWKEGTSLHDTFFTGKNCLNKYIALLWPYKRGEFFFAESHQKRNMKHLSLRRLLFLEVADLSLSWLSLLCCCFILTPSSGRELPVLRGGVTSITCISVNQQFNKNNDMATIRQNIYVHCMINTLQSIYLSWRLGIPA